MTPLRGRRRAGLVRRRRLRGVAQLDANGTKEATAATIWLGDCTSKPERALNSDVTTGNADRRWCVPETECSVCEAAMGESEHPGSRAERRLGVLPESVLYHDWH